MCSWDRVKVEVGLRRDGGRRNLGGRKENKFSKWSLGNSQITVSERRLNERLQVGLRRELKSRARGSPGGFLINSLR